MVSTHQPSSLTPSLTVGWTVVLSHVMVRVASEVVAAVAVVAVGCILM